MTATLHIAPLYPCIVIDVIETHADCTQFTVLMSHWRPRLECLSSNDHCVGNQTDDVIARGKASSRTISGSLDGNTKRCLSWTINCTTVHLALILIKEIPARQILFETRYSDMAKLATSTFIAHLKSLYPAPTELTASADGGWLKKNYRGVHLDDLHSSFQKPMVHRSHRSIQHRQQA